MSSKYTKLISNHFAGITEDDILTHKKSVKRVRKNTDNLIKRESKKLREVI